MKHTTHARPVTVAGIGIGPANLSLAALLRPHATVSARFFERTAQFQWHPGMMLPDARLQVHYLKDLVSLVDPSNPLSFLAYLAEHKRLLTFINAQFEQVLRREFNLYYRWACDKLDTLAFGKEVQAVHYRDGAFTLQGDGWQQRARHLVLGTGQQPYVPACAKALLGETVFHASHYMAKPRALRGQQVVVVGGGQTGAEIIQHLLADTASLPASVTWLSRRGNFSPLDDSPFANELYTPQYSNHFYGLPEAVRRPLLQEQTLASDGVSQGLLQAIYRRAYEIKHVLQHPCQISLLPGRELTGLQGSDGHWSLSAIHHQRQARETLQAGTVILCTGYRYHIPAFLEPLSGLIPLNAGEYHVNADYSIQWAGAPANRIYVQNAARQQKGIADPNLGLVPWRCANIINSLAGQALYDTGLTESLVKWDALQATPPVGANAVGGRELAAVQ